MKRLTLAVAAAALAVLSFGTAPALADTADTVAPSGTTTTADAKSILKQLGETGTVTLESGGTYYLASPIKLTDNLKKNITINAQGATVIAQSDVMTNVPTKSGYADIENITINGGTWDSASKTGFKGTSFGFMHGSNIVMRDMNVLHAGYDGHAFEFIGCKNVAMDHVTVSPKGTAGKSQETMVQIDIASSETAPRLRGTGLCNGATCKNVTIKNCDIKGNRAVATGWSYSTKKWVSKSHTGIKISNSTLTAYSGEGLALYNTKDAQVTGNTIVSNSKKTSDVKSCGLHILSEGKISGTKYTVTGNTIKGGIHAVRAWSTTSTKLGTVTLKNNKLYCKKGKKSAINVSKKAVKRVSSSKNKTYAWR